MPQTTNETDTSYFGEKKMFTPGDYGSLGSATHGKQPPSKKRSSILAFDFHTLNVKSLARKNKEDAINAIKQLGTPKSRKRRSAKFTMGDTLGSPKPE